MTNMTAGVHSAKYLMGLGQPPLPKNGAVCVTSVLHTESSLNPGSQGVQASEHGGVLNPSGAFGIASWNGGRQGKLKHFCDTRTPPIPYADLDSQLRFVLNECANDYHQAWAAITNPSLSLDDMIQAFVAHYEIPLNVQAEVNRAIAYAHELAPLVPDTVPPVVLPPPTPPPTQPIPPTPTTLPFPTIPDTGTTDMNPAILGLLLQALPPLFRIIEAILQHAATTVPSVPATNPSTPPPTIPIPQQPGQIDLLGTIFQAMRASPVGQQILQAILQSLQPK